MPRKVRLVKQDQTVGAGHCGVDGRPTGPVASEQQTGAVHRECAQDNGRPRGVRGRARGDAAPKADYVQRGRGGVDPQRTKPFGDAFDDMAPGGIQPRRFRVVKRTRDLPGVFGRRVHEEAPVDDPPDACR